MPAIKKTNAARVLDRLGIAYQLASYRVDPDDVSAKHVAETIGVNPAKVFKTLLTKGTPNGLAFCVVPAAAELDLKKFASVFQNKRAELVPLKDLLPLTGYVRGGCSPIGAKKNYPVCIDSSAMQFSSVYVSAGQRGLQFIINPNDLAKAVNAVFADIIMI